jgi:hypothetical protein
MQTQASERRRNAVKNHHLMGMEVSCGAWDYRRMNFRRECVLAGQIGHL